MLHTVAVEGVGTYVMCDEHAEAIHMLAAPRSVLVALLARSGDYACDACRKKGVDYAYVAAHARDYSGGKR